MRLASTSARILSGGFASRAITNLRLWAATIAPQRGMCGQSPNDVPMRLPLCHAPAVHYMEEPIGGPGLRRYLDALATTRADGATKVARLKAVDIADDERWFPIGSLADTYETFRNLLTSDAAVQALPEVLADASFPSGQPPIFYGVTCGALTLEVELARLLCAGGAYVRFAGSDAKAKRIAADAARDLLQDRYEDFRVFHSDAAWTPWFFDVAWDSTWLLVDDANKEVTVFATTDTD